MAKPKKPNTNWTKSVPFCSGEECALYDGKRCEALGFSPDSICEPVVRRVVNLAVRAGVKRADVEDT